MMDSLKQRIINHIDANQPVKRADLKDAIGIPGRALDREIAVLKELGVIHSAAGFGYFSGVDSYESWRKGEGAIHLQMRGVKGAISSAASRRESLTTYPARIASLLSDGDELSAVETAEELGVTYRHISSAITTMVSTGELKHKGPYGHRVYSLCNSKKKVINRTESVNVICQECRTSPAMKRVLAFYGRVSA